MPIWGGGATQADLDAVKSDVSDLQFDVATADQGVADLHTQLVDYSTVETRAMDGHITKYFKWDASSTNTDNAPVSRFSFISPHDSFEIKLYTRQYSGYTSFYVAGSTRCTMTARYSACGPHNSSNGNVTTYTASAVQHRHMRDTSGNSRMSIGYAQSPLYSQFIDLTVNDDRGEGQGVHQFMISITPCDTNRLLMAVKYLGGAIVSTDT